MVKLSRFLKPYWKEAVFGSLFKFLEVVLELFLPTIMALIINQGVAMRDTAYVWKMGLAMVLLSVLGYGSALICQRLASTASQGVGTQLRSAVFDRVLSFSYAQMDLFGAPSLANRITNDINQMQQWVAMMIRLVSRAPFIAIGSIVMMFLLDARLALLLVAATPVLAGIIYGITKASAPLYRTYQTLLDKLGNVLRENLDGVRVIRAFSKTKAEQQRFEKANAALRATGFGIGRISALFNPLTSLVINLMVVAVLWISGGHIQMGTLQQGQVIAFINYASQLLLALMILSNLVILLTKSMASAARLNEVLETAPDMLLPQKSAEPRQEAPAIEFRDVSFAYSKTGEQALSHITCTIERGEMVGIIGGTGSGKSTFVHLLAHFYAPTEGQILLFGVPLASYSHQDLRKHLGLVPQKAVLFSGSVTDNIRWGKRDASRSDVERAAETAQATDFIRQLPHGFDSQINRGGQNLSGGPRQRLTIARALVGSPDILVLDDATSALDYATDARLRRALRSGHAGQTVLLISQRVGVIEHCDTILVFDDGALVGMGKHKELLQCCQAYRDICYAQLSEEELEA